VAFFYGFVPFIKETVLFVEMMKQTSLRLVCPRNLIFLEEQSVLLEAQPAHKLAVPLFLFTSIPYFITLLLDYIGCCKVDKTFMWFGAFYLGLSLVYMLVRLFDKR